MLAELCMSNPICHWELMVGDPPKARAFYAKVFDWKFDATSSPEYTMINTGKEPFGGMLQKPPHAPMPALNVYFAVESVDMTLRNALEAGARVIVQKTEVPGVGWFAMFLDPDGIPVGVFQQRDRAA